MLRYATFRKKKWFKNGFPWSCTWCHSPPTISTYYRCHGLKWYEVLPSGTKPFLKIPSSHPNNRNIIPNSTPNSTSDNIALNEQVIGLFCFGRSAFSGILQNCSKLHKKRFLCSIYTKLHKKKSIYSPIKGRTPSRCWALFMAYKRVKKTRGLFIERRESFAGTDWILTQIINLLFL